MLDRRDLPSLVAGAPIQIRQASARCLRRRDSAVAASPLLEAAGPFAGSPNSSGDPSEGGKAGGADAAFHKPYVSRSGSCPRCQKSLILLVGAPGLEPGTR